MNNPTILTASDGDSGFAWRIPNPFRPGEFSYLTGNNYYVDFINGSWVEATLLTNGTDNSSAIELQAGETYELHGNDANDAFLITGAFDISAVKGGAGTDALFADFSTQSTGITWDMTQNNDAEKTLENGLTVQSIDRVFLRTGTGNDRIVLSADSHSIFDAGGNNSFTMEFAYVDIFTGDGNDTFDLSNVLFAEIGAGDGDDVFNLFAIADSNAATQITLVGDGGTDTLNIRLDDEIAVVNGNELRAQYHYDVKIGGQLLTLTADDDLQNLAGLPAGFDIVAWLEGDLAGSGTKFSPNDWIQLNLNKGDEGTDGLRTVVNIQGGIEQLNAVGTSRNDLIFGLTGNDRLQGEDGDDKLFGRAGDDYLDGGAGADQLYGGSGNDTYVLSDTLDQFIEREDHGIDTIETAFLDVSLRDYENIENLTFTSDSGVTGEGNHLDNVLTGAGGIDFLYGGAGNDTLNGGDSTDALFGGEDDDTLNGDGGDDGLDGGTGNDTLNGGSGVDWLFGQEGDDVLNGGDDTDALFGGADNDTLFGGGGDDGLDGGYGDDVLHGGSGTDWLYGGFGNDTLYGAQADEDSNDTDALFGQEGDDTLYGGSGGDSLDGGADNDRLFGQDGVDWLFGQDGNDHLDGGADGDVLFGGEGNDTLIGGSGGDSLDGGAGQDTLTGGAGVDILFGGAGADTFRFTDKTDEEDIIRDFVSGEDRIEIELAGFGLLEPAQFLSGNGLPATVGDGLDSVFYYEQETNSLWYYEVNQGQTEQPIKIAGLETGTLTESDLVFV